LNPSFLCIPFELWSYNLSFILNRIHSFFASPSNYGNAIWASPKLHPYFLCILFKLLTYNYELPPKLHPSSFCMPIDYFLCIPCKLWTDNFCFLLKLQLSFLCIPIETMCVSFPARLGSILCWYQSAQIVNPGIKPSCRW
jgi:hypothetical protein